ncbi:MAG TPA: family 20 glycosylhydrolase [Prolixibacteraceae bacterium]|nr:family 20 glycosylhydrolase [Prolixibacteraceae bacterium]
MKRIITLAMLFVFVQLNAQPSLVPQPVLVELQTGYFELSKTNTISFIGSQSEKIAQMLATKLSISTGYQFLTKEGKSGDIRFKLNTKPDEILGNEGYTLLVNSNTVEISANKPSGLFYGMQTLLQLFPAEIESNKTITAEWKIPSVKITDYPRFGWRGIMLDVSRHFFTKEEVKTHIEQLSKYKFNTFHWHLSDDNGWRVEIKSLPKLTEIGAWRVERNGQFSERANPKPGEPATYGGFYTQEDIKEIVAFANERNVTIVPEIDIPGHSMAAIAAYPELCCTKDTSIKVNPGTPFSEWYADGSFKMLIDNTLNPSDEKVYEFLDKVFTEIAALFPNEYIHVGGDECYKGYWANDPGCQALMKKMNINELEDLQTYFMNRVSNILKSKNKKMLGWDADNELTADATVMCWRGFKGAIEAAKLGHNVVMTPSLWAYLDYQQGELTIEPPVYESLRLKKCYELEPVPDGVDSKYILGGQGNLWAENVPTFRYAQYMTYPRAWSLSEVFWSPKESRNWSSFQNKLEAHFQRADIAEVNYSKAIYDPIINISKKNDKLWLEMECEAPRVDIYYTVDCTMPDIFSSKYTNAIELPDGPITLRTIAYRSGKPIGHLITLTREELEKRVRK